MKKIILFSLVILTSFALQAQESTQVKKFHWGGYSHFSNSIGSTEIFGYQGGFMAKYKISQNDKLFAKANLGYGFLEFDDFELNNQTASLQTDFIALSISTDVRIKGNLLFTTGIKSHFLTEVNFKTNPTQNVKSQFQSFQTYNFGFAYEFSIGEKGVLQLYTQYEVGLNSYIKEEDKNLNLFNFGIAIIF